MAGSKKVRDLKSDFNFGSDFPNTNNQQLSTINSPNSITTAQVSDTTMMP